MTKWKSTSRNCSGGSYITLCGVEELKDSGMFLRMRDWNSPSLVRKVVNTNEASVN